MNAKVDGLETGEYDDWLLGGSVDVFFLEVCKIGKCSEISRNDFNGRKVAEKWTETGI